MDTCEDIKSSCKRFFEDSMRPLLQTDLYLWFNQPCIYKCSTLDEFFKVINYEENAADFTWHDFDYYIYMYYLILYHDFKIEDIEIESKYGICEASFEFLRFKSNKYEKCNIWMCSQATLPKFDNPNLFIIVHLDRDTGWQIRSLNIRLVGILRQIDDLYSQISFLRNALDGIRRSKSYLVGRMITWLPRKLLRR